MYKDGEIKNKKLDNKNKVIIFPLKENKGFLYGVH